MNKIEQNLDSLAPDEILKLIQEIKGLRQYFLSYNQSIHQKIDAIEKNIELLESENNRLASAKRTVYIERDACIALLCRLAMRLGHPVGVTPTNQVYLELPSGPVTWTIHKEEMHLFSDFPPYPATNPSLQEQPIEETYYRIMNPSLPPQ